ncbi:hypothetical protein [Streptomyces fructofermentans]|uniref:hypothetical protein n=1 Tax=Streptomyces fructofermentans TaxID=152141 RepID=UPI00379F3C55
MSEFGEHPRHDEYGRGDSDDNEHDQHAGNGTVNHGPSDNSGPEESGFSDLDGFLAAFPPVASSADTADTAGGADGTDGAGSHGSDDPHGSDRFSKAKAAGPGERGTGGDSDVFGTGGFAVGALRAQTAASEPARAEEQALRSLMHRVVDEIEPTDGTLEHLRRAVPARRARKRQAVVGMAAAALFVGTAVPALIHVSNATGSDADPSIVANGRNTQGSSSEGKHSDTQGGSGDSSGASKGTGKGDGKTRPGTGGDTDGTTGAQPSASAAGAAACTSAQLGGAGAVGTPDAAGAVYGSFTITNVSTAACTVAGAGSVSTIAQGAADQARLGTVLHAAGDPAAGLPDPSTYATSPVLQPGIAYTVRFAWVPSDSCPTTGGGGDPTPDPTPSDTTNGGSGTSSEGTNGVSTQMMRTEGVADGKVVVSYTAEGGAANASVTVPDACAGTVYQTGVLVGS